MKITTLCPCLLFLLLAAECHSNASQMYSSCCNVHIPANWTECRSACLQFGSSCPPNVINKTGYLTSYCPSIPTALEACFENISNIPVPPTPSTELLQCCNKSSNQDCRRVCTEQVILGALDQAALNLVVAECGPPFPPPSDPLWSCFLLYAAAEGESQEPQMSEEEPDSSCTNSPVPTPTTLPTATPTATPTTPPTFHYADWPRLQCCSMANDSSCSKACHYEYTGSRTTWSWNTLNLDCIFRPSEGRLVSCLEDVSARCRSGCNGLQFCSSFNNRPLTSFRKCTTTADTNAKIEFNGWLSSSVINHPFVRIKTRPLTSCYPERWKVLACSFQVMPCQPNTHTSLICKEDCLHLMNECKASLIQSSEEICEILSPSYLQKDCIKIDDFLNESNYSGEASVLTTPCTSSPCTSGKCIINQDCTSSGGANCLPYYCVEEAEVGNHPKMVLERVELVHASLLPGNDGEGCHGYVNCSLDANGRCIFGGKLSNVSGQYCIEKTSCHYRGINYKHYETFSDDCNICQCLSGNVNCTHHDCPSAQSGGASGMTKTCSPPYCSCPSFYNPICTSNGLTLPNLFYSNCHSYTNGLVIGQSCYKNNPCSSSSSLCPAGSKCIPARHVCMSANGSALQDCPQYYCVNDRNCDQYRGKVICDQSGSEHESVCEFTNTYEKVDYYGYCRVECSLDNRRPVCSVNGETYPSICHARGMGLPIDYYEGCKDTPKSETGTCDNIKCPDMPYTSNSEQCTGPTPPGACCQQCGSMINILVNKAQLSRSAKALGVASIDSSQVINRLRAYVDILQCELYGYQSIDGSIIVLLLPSNMTSWINVEACNVVGTRLTSLINRRSPLLAMDPYLSFLLAAKTTSANKITRPTSTQEPTAGSVGVSGCGSLKPSISALLLIMTFLWARLLLDQR